MREDSVGDSRRDKREVYLYRVGAQNKMSQSEI